MHTGYYFGAFLAALVNYGIGAHYGWRAMFAIGGAPALLIFFIRYGVREPERWERRAKESRECEPRLSIALFARVSAANAVERSASADFDGRIVGRDRCTHQPQLPSLPSREGYSTVEAAKLASNATMLLSAGTILGCLFVPWLAGRFGRRGALAFFFVLMAVFIALGFGYVFYLAHAPLMPFILCLFFLGIGGASFCVFTVWLPEQYRTECRASAFAFATSFGRFLAAGATFAVGAGISRSGTLGTPVAFTALAFIAGLLILPFGEETKGKSLPA